MIKDHTIAMVFYRSRSINEGRGSQISYITSSVQSSKKRWDLPCRNILLKPNAYQQINILRKRDLHTRLQLTCAWKIEYLPCCWLVCSTLKSSTQGSEKSCWVRPETFSGNALNGVTPISWWKSENSSGHGTKHGFYFPLLYNHSSTRIYPLPSRD